MTGFLNVENRKSHSKSLPDALSIEKLNSSESENRKNSFSPKENLKIDKFKYQNWNFPLLLPPKIEENIISIQIIESIITNHVEYKIEIKCEENKKNWTIYRR